jgi:NAD(P)-dependent dehydrogenase (short-subunit alcohol dehydrogenase family)
LNGDIALITGGVKNLGAATAEKLASVCANLELHYTTTLQVARTMQLDASLNKDSSLKVAFYQGDLTTATAVEHLFQSMVKGFGKINIVVNTVDKVLEEAHYQDIGGGI